MSFEYYGVAQEPYLLSLGLVIDERGELRFIEGKILPFSIKRFFSIGVVNTSVTRGKHAHKECWQAFFPHIGACEIIVRNVNGTLHFKLNQDQILIVPPFNWCEILFENSDTIVNVLASHEFDSNDYLLTTPGSD